MLTLNDGRSELWQWDTNRKLTVDAECSQVHFSNKVLGRSIDVDVVDGVADIPDILLQTDRDLIAWAFVGTAENGYTKISKVFKVNKRNKPADYVFTPPEQTTLEEIKEKIEYLESIQDPDAIKNAVEDYLEQNPVEAPVQSVNGKTGKVKLTSKDLGAISQDDLQKATNKALAQAKESGEFDGAPGPSGPQGADGGYYIPSVTQTSEETLQFEFSPSKPDMPAVNPVTVELPAGPGSGGNVDYVGVEPADDDIPKFFYGGDLPQTKDDTVMPFRYISKTEDISGYCETKAQGTSSMSYAKKNQTTKFYKDAGCTEKMKVDFKGWGEQRKFCFKANWIDISHARNIVSARLWADVVKSRDNYTELPELLRTSPNQGAIDGFPVKVYANGVYQGRYTLNIPKDGWMANMDDENEAHCILCGENYGSGCFRATANINGSDWSDELHETVPASIKTRWNEVIDFVMNSTDDDFRVNLSNYFDIPSLIDYHLFGLASCGLDAYGKNQIYMTYDGQRWIASMYDMDSTWGLYYNGSKFVSTNYGRTSYEDFVNGRQGNLLYIRLEQLFWAELQTRWAELKNGALSIENIINRFERFTDIASAELVKEDYASTTGGGKFTGIPSQSTNNIQQIRAFALARQAWTDAYVAGLTPEVEVPCTGISLNTNTLTFTAEGSQTLTATVTPDGCTDPVRWVSDNTSIATVADGVVTAVANGSATITAYCGEYSASCSVAVSGIVACTGITLDQTRLAFEGEGTQTITATVTPSDTTNPVVWVSSAPAVASISVEGNVCTVQSVANGSATITVTCGDYSAICSVTVIGFGDDFLVYSLYEATTFDGTSDFIDTGVQLAKEDIDFTIVLEATAGTGNAANDALYHCMKEASGYPGYALAVSGAYYKSIAYDKGTNSAVPANDAEFKYVVTHTAGTNRITAMFMYNGEVYTYVTPWSYHSSVEQNLLIGAYQTVDGTKGRFWSGTLHDFKIYNRVLSDDEIDAYLHTTCSGITLSASELTFTAEGSRTLTATVTPDGCTEDIVWVSSSPSSIARISADGNVCTVTAVANGDSTITVNCGKYSASCTVSISGIEQGEEETLVPVSDGLVRYFDFSEYGNTDAPKKIADKIGSGAVFKLNSFAYDDTDGFVDNMLVTDGTTGQFALCEDFPIDTANDFTLEVIQEFAGIGTNSTGNLGFGCWENNTWRFGFGMYSLVWRDTAFTTNSGYSKTIIPTYDKNGETASSTIVGHPYHSIITWDASEQKLYVHGEKVENGAYAYYDTTGVDVGCQLADISKVYLGLKADDNGFVAGKIGMLRLYNRMLTEEEIKNNIDFELTIQRGTPTT